MSRRAGFGPRAAGCRPWFKPIIRKCKYLSWKRAEQTSVTQTHHRWGSGGGAPSCWAIFWQKKAILMLLDHISLMFRAI